MVLVALTKRYKEGAKYGTLNLLRSAIARVNLTHNSDSKLLNQFFKSVFLLRPTSSKYTSSWDVDTVLKEIKSWGMGTGMGLEKLTLKVTMLLALGAAYRSQSLAMIRLTGMRFTSEGVEIQIQGITKTNKPGSKNPKSFFPLFKDQPELCIASTLMAYREATHNIRGGEDQLLISYRTPYKAVTSQTVGRWLKTVMGMAGIEDTYTAHSTRHASSSAAKRKGLSVASIKDSVGWSNSSQVFSKFYDKPLSKMEDNFAYVVFS